MYDLKNLAKFKRMGELAPEAFRAFDTTAFAGGVIPLKYKELMAVAVALTTQCPYCIEIHYGKAKGATEQELPATPTRHPHRPATC